MNVNLTCVSSSSSRGINRSNKRNQWWQQRVAFKGAAALGERPARIVRETSAFTSSLPSFTYAFHNCFNLLILPLSFAFSLPLFLSRSLSLALTSSLHTLRVGVATDLKELHTTLV